MKATRFAMTSTTPDRDHEAKALAAKWGFDYLNSDETQALTHYHYDYLLVLSAQGLGIQKTDDRQANPFSIDFLSKQMRYRCQQAGLRREHVARAIGIHPRHHPVIIDATAGLGRDSFILATLGYRVTAIEQSAALCALLEDALLRARQEPLFSQTIDRLQLVHADARQWLQAHAIQQPADVIYLDPMFPERKKSASVKKEMVILQNVLGKADNLQELFDAACACATKRVVVKRPRLAANIAERAPNFSITGKNARFDIYLV